MQAPQSIDPGAGQTTAAAPEAFVRAKAQAPRDASAAMIALSADSKHVALRRIAEEVRRATPQILAANETDMAEGRKADLGSKLDRLLLTEERIEAICGEIEEVIGLEDPVGQVIDTRHLVPPDRYARIKEAFEATGTFRLTPVLESLGSDYSYEELTLVRLALRQSLK